MNADTFNGSPAWNMSPGTSAFDIEDQAEEAEAAFWRNLGPGKPSEEEMER